LEQRLVAGHYEQLLGVLELEVDAMQFGVGGGREDADLVELVLGLGVDRRFPCEGL
jgi:hypothetical protein